MGGGAACCHRCDPILWHFDTNFLVSMALRHHEALQSTLATLEQHPDHMMSMLALKPCQTHPKIHVSRHLIKLYQFLSRFCLLLDENKNWISSRRRRTSRACNEFSSQKDVLIIQVIHSFLFIPSDGFSHMGRLWEQSRKWNDADDNLRDDEMSHELVLRVLKASMRESCKRNFHFAVKMFLILLNACEALMFARILNFHFFFLHPRSLVPCRSSAPATTPHQSQQHVTDVA